MLKTSTLIAGFFLVTIAGCNNGSPTEALYPPSTVNNPQSCSLNGNWKRCTDEGGGRSTKLELSISNSTMSENILSYDTSSDCSGTPASQFTINASLHVGTPGASTAITGGTDVDLTPNVDVFGCGLGQTAYTVIALQTENCDQFQFANTAPACSANNRGNAFEAQPFLRQ